MNRVKEFINSHYSTPRGLIGTYIGEKMVRQHKPETLWSIENLDIQAGQSVLELGCGSGYALKLILKQNIADKVVGLDLSATMIRSAMLRNKKELDEEKVKLVQANVNHLPFEDEHFDKVFSIHTIYFWEELSNTVSEIFRVLKPGGRIILTLCDGKNGEVWEEVKEMIGEKLIPIMKKRGFVELELIKGPNSRQFHTVAVFGKKGLELDS